VVFTGDLVAPFLRIGQDGLVTIRRVTVTWGIFCPGEALLFLSFGSIVKMYLLGTLGDCRREIQS
jgi:hypothetical protein